MEFLDEDVRPRFQLQTKTLDQSTAAATHRALSKSFLFITVALSSALIVFSLFCLHSEPFTSLLLWLSLSLLVGPFAPPSLTAGDVRVGHGPAVDFPSPPPSDADDPPAEKKSKSKSRRSERSEAPAMAEMEALGERKRAPKVEDETWEEREWTDEEIEMLRKQLVKNPAGMPGRWEAIAESFRGRHRLESVIRKAKDAGERRRSDEDSYSEFLRKRKPADKRLLAEQGTEDLNSCEEVWSSGEDIALLNALKAFPKEVALRWEKVAAAVQGKTKAACVKRVAELKKGFRSSKKAAMAEDRES